MSNEIEKLVAEFADLPQSDRKWAICFLFGLRYTVDIQKDSGREKAFDAVLKILDEIYQSTKEVKP